MGKQKPTSTMVIETVFTEGIAQLSYLIGDKAMGKAVVIDPRNDIEPYIDLARSNNLVITHALETHIHADFVSGCRELAARTGTAKVFVSVEGGASYGFPHEKLRDKDKIDLGRVILAARHTPGHTPEHMSYVAVERKIACGLWAAPVVRLPFSKHGSPRSLEDAASGHNTLEARHNEECYCNAPTYL